MRRALPAPAVGVVTSALLAGCAYLPAPPDPVPTSVVPTTVPAPGAEADGSQLSPDGFDAAQRMAVRIRNIGCGALSTGSGFALDAHTLVTNRHVVADSAELQLSTYDGRDVAAEAASTAGLADLAVVRTVDALPAAPVLAEADPQVGDPVTVVGYPLGRRLTVTDGRVVAAVTDPLHTNLGEVLVTDAPVEPGSSGSAALDADGRVIGVVYAKNAENMSFLVPVSTLRAMLEDDTAFAPAPTCG
ncbi:S1C family serine protease [Cellulomonas wangsupingiae]|uniref:Trypsin-like peptidase domain-containing protein n=1 Tax=Cellulomonas wangsupingiae TaxID=2968085 RepID=A0ABY5KCG4_9CELL|nr:trypsin-like peptidase domain-containing protein [Cellulomonas wangsupingiae]MCC2335171.1 trypsin-like peptidase domain-containing protein [Cellulomonas wangsupingiae]UUI66681.1 trypsin-like peptidase domain-containing protein [Cellulomonas wangsupingiae]